MDTDAATHAISNATRICSLIKLLEDEYKSYIRTHRLQKLLNRKSYVYHLGTYIWRMTSLYGELDKVLADSRELDDGTQETIIHIIMISETDYHPSQQTIRDGLMFSARK